MPILREGYHNTRFPPQWTTPDYDVTFLGIVACFVVLYLGFLILLPSFKMNMKTLYFYLMITFDLFLGWVIIDCNWAYEWQSASVTTETFYAPYDPRKINATLGLHMGLRGFNITLQGIPTLQFGQIIDYNEEFLWSEHRGERAPWQQGRFGFGLYAGSVAQKFREWQFRGYPQIITELAEYFTLDGDGIRWYRWYRIAGWYAHIALWTALPLWALTNALFIMKPSTGAMWLVFTGACMEFCVMLYGIIIEHISHVPFKVPYPGGVLALEFGWTFNLVLAMGVVSIVFGAALYVYLMYHPEIDHNLLADPEATDNDDEPEEVQEHPENKIPPHRRHSEYGHHTVKKRTSVPATSPAAMTTPGIVETKMDSITSTTANTIAANSSNLPMQSGGLKVAAGEIEMLPMDRMMSTSGRGMYMVDETGLDPHRPSISLKRDGIELAPMRAAEPTTMQASNSAMPAFEEAPMTADGQEQPCEVFYL